MFVKRVIIFDHSRRSIQLVDVRPIAENGKPAAWQNDYENRIRNASTELPVPSVAPHNGHFSFVDKEQYFQRVEWCKARLREGQSYQLCLTTEARLSNVPSPWAFYRALRRSNRPPFAAYLKFDHCEIASSSPSYFSPERGIINFEQSRLRALVPVGRIRLKTSHYRRLSREVQRTRRRIS